MPSACAAWQEVQALLDEEISGLPETLRETFVSCCLENQSCADVARQFQLTEPTVRKRLSRARKLLQERLTRRGVSLATVLAAAVVGANNALATVPRCLVSTIAKAATQIAVGQTLAGSLVPAKVITLMQGVHQTMFVSKCKTVLLLLLSTAIVGAGLGLAGVRYAGAESHQPAPEQPKQGKPRQDGVAANAKDEVIVKVRGQVLAPDGKPVVGAKLYLNTFNPRDRQLPVRATSATNGRFEFTFARSELDTTYTDNPTGQVLAVAGGLGFDVATVGPSDKAELTLRLVKDVPLNGRILDEEGRPVAGAKVRVNDVWAYKGEDLNDELAKLRKGGFGSEALKGWNGPIPGQPSAITTGADGRFRLSGLGRERMIYLEVEGPGIQYNRIQVMTRVSATVVSTDSAHRVSRIYGATFDHLAAPSRSLRGVVRDKETGKPVAGVQISSVFTTHRAMTDKDGRYELLGCPKSRRYDLSATAPDGQPYFTANSTFSDTQGLAPLDANIELVRGIPLRGRVTDKDTGKPIKGAQVEYCPLYPNPNTQHGSRDSSAVAGPNGAFSLVVVPGPGLLAVTAVNVPANQYMSALVTPREMKAFYKNWADPGNNTEDFLIVSARGLASRGLIQENYHALVMIEPDAKTDKLTRDVALQPARTLKGTVVGPNGEPLAGVTVFGLSFHSFSDETLKSAHFTVGGLNPRRTRKLLFFHQEKGLGCYQEIRGDAKGPLAIRLQPLGSASGRVVDKDGQPVAGLILHVNRYRLMGPGSVQVKTDKDGRFRAEGLVPGQKYQLSPAQRSLNLPRGGAAVIVVESGKDKNLGDVTVESGR